MKFISQHNKEYSSVEEFQEKFEVFKVNLDNASNHESFSPFMDMTTEEFQYQLTLNTSAIPAARATMERYTLKGLVEAPATHDWRDHGVVNAIKNQGQCGSCWAFSAIANIESQYALKNGKLLDLSEQELVDCDTIDYGCGGGWMDNAFKWFETSGVMTGKDYPYRGVGGTCKYDADRSIFKLKSYQDVSKNESDIKNVVFEHGPLSVAVDASAFQFYPGGIMTAKECNYRQLNHGVAIVGYGTENGVDFWIVRNSWGAGWGENGYIRVERGAGACGINTTVSTAVLN